MQADDDLDKVLLPLRLVITAMIAGIAIFGLVVLVIGPVQDDPELARILLLALGAVGVAEVPAYWVLRGALMTKLRRAFEQDASPDDPAARVMPILSTLTLIGGAMAEGFGLFGTVVFLVTGVPAALIAPMIAVAILAARFPTRSKLDQLVSTLMRRCPY